MKLLEGELIRTFPTYMSYEIVAVIRVSKCSICFPAYYLQQKHAQAKNVRLHGEGAINGILTGPIATARKNQM
jgi:hypothetical protein